MADSVFDSYQPKINKQDKYDVAQVCLNGHVVNPIVKSTPEDCDPYCEVCGEKTITQCEKCNAPIRGYSLAYSNPHLYEPPAYCRQCGQSYPWTERTIQTAVVRIAEDLSLDESEKIQIEEHVNDLMKRTPNQNLAARFFRGVWGRLKEETRKLVVDIASETCRKIIMDQITK